MQTSFEPLEVFLEICKIPHPSKDCKEMKEWIKKEASKFGVKIYEDTIGNILCSKGIPKVCLQGHYDMVYVGECKDFSIQPQFFSVENKEWLKAQCSSLGADNGVALACMLLALKYFDNLECLFTIDEEIGMIGAKNIALKPQSPFMINCDSEDINEVVFSCAGGYDLKATKTFKKIPIPQDFQHYAIHTQNFIGGHSGIEIHKNIPNALLELAKIVEATEGIVLTFFGGEKRNSIPVNATLKIACSPKHTALIEHLPKEFFSISKLKDSPNEGYDCKDLAKSLLKVGNGVLKSLNNAPILSSNIGILEQHQDNFTLFLMGRGNEESLMQENIQKQQTFLEDLGFAAHLLDYYSPWEKEEGELLFKVWNIYQKYNPNSYLKSIHAGLECGILKQKYPHIHFVSIGPTILHPHSLNEKLDIASFQHFWEILQKILKTMT
ncbi:M20/M25/M40 family metallo-hydrolase [Helicobacter apodemus]|uniref:Peptidase n=1 Tax=Helicobacter apodemus TaxID=135569 RepID=A0A2U8FGS2_9HELI|nr:M20/M25/M40 family metallo-hydrolase [Helicobacter apodemus]AWI34987.1 peptidase [Helicobacter apodemus]